MQVYPIPYEDVFAIPEFHAKKMDLMPTAGKSHSKFPDTFFHTAFYVRIDDIVNERDLHPADLRVIIVLIEEHHTLEDGKEKDLCTDHDKHK